MKRGIKNHLLVGLFATLLLTGCGSDDNTAPDKTQVFLQTWVGTWELKTATRDGVVITDVFEDLVVTFNSDNTLKSVPEVLPFWPAKENYGNPVYSDNEVKVIREDGITMIVESMTATNLKLSITILHAAGRVNEIEGEVVFEFTKRN